MIELDQMKATLSAYKEPLKEVGDSLELEAKGRKIEELSGLLESPGFWDDVEKAQKMSRELNELKQIVEGYQKLQRQYEDIEALIEMGYEENDITITFRKEFTLEDLPTLLDAKSIAK